MTSSNLCMVGWDDFRKKKKKRLENWRKYGCEGCLVGRGGERRKWWGLTLFAPSPPKLDFSKLKRK